MCGGKLTELKGEMDKTRVTVGDFNALSARDRTIR